jgi:outer membrane lipoprotein-sorting protein
VKVDRARRRLLAGAALTLGGLPFGAALAATGDGDRAKAIDRVEAYLNGIETLSAEFLQVGPNGEIALGKMYLRRPGRLRFEYAPPSPLLLVADGLWLILHDKELGQVDRFPLSQTPLGVLVDEQVDLRDKVEVVEVEQGPGLLRLLMIDRKQPDEGWLSITFTQPPLLLRQWRVKDAQGGITSVSLTNIRLNRELDPELFTFTDPQPFRE